MPQPPLPAPPPVRPWRRVWQALLWHWALASLLLSGLFHQADGDAHRLGQALAWALLAAVAATAADALARPLAAAWSPRAHESADSPAGPAH